MSHYSEKSINKLRTCHGDIQKVFIEVDKYWPHTILEGHRSQKEQEEAFTTGHSTKHFPDSAHNKFPSLGVDAIPDNIDWSDLDGKNGTRAKQIAWNTVCKFAGFVLGIAAMMKVNLISGIDWDGDKDLSDQNFIDAPHFQVTVK